MEAQTEGDAGVSRIATTLILLQKIAEKALTHDSVKAIMNWNVQNFVVAEIDQRQRKKTEWNVRIRCDTYTERQKNLWAPTFKEVTLAQFCQTLKCEKIYLYVKGADIAKNRFTQPAPDVSVKLVVNTTEFKRLTDSLPTSMKPSLVLPETDALDELDILLAKYGEAFDPVDKKRICGIGMKRCVSCTCLNED